MIGSVLRSLRRFIDIAYTIQQVGPRVYLRQRRMVRAAVVDPRTWAALASDYRRQTGAPLFVPQTMYDHMVASGCDMANIEPVRPMPLHAGPS